MCDNSVLIQSANDNEQSLSTVQAKFVAELPEPYRDVFSPRFQRFNKIQSNLLDLIIKTDKSLVICSPTASGKTVLLELTIISELIRLESSNRSHPPYDQLHALYLAPLKAIVEEKCQEWQQRFAKFGLKCFAMTGDTDIVDYQKYLKEQKQQVNILLATPEKFDSIIRTHSESRSLLRLLNLIMIDEIHMLGDRNRGDFLEATITRLKFIRDNNNHIIKVLGELDGDRSKERQRLRFVAISATSPNVEDLSIWLDPRNSLGIRVPADWRPVKLNKLVIGIEPTGAAQTSDYRFDIQITYKLERLIREHSESKPTLVFCSTRRSAEFTAKILATSQNTYFESRQQHIKLFMELSRINENATNIDTLIISKMEFEHFKNTELKTTLAAGVAFYHSGMDPSDRRLLEHLFSMSLIPVLVSTSSLAMGVNLPAHLVVIKNTVQYEAGSQTEYHLSQILQMIGRAGRPQFDTSATAIIVTKQEKKEKYETLLGEETDVESNLFRSLIEHLMIEIVLKTVNNINLAIDWIYSTFLFIRIVQNPQYYRSSIAKGDYDGARPIILEWCQEQMQRLQTLGLITIKGDFFDPTQLARIVTRYSVSIATLEHLIKWSKISYSLEQLLEEMCCCTELSQDVILRTTDKRFLNELNKKNRFKYKDRFRNGSMKTNCLAQAAFESLTIEQCLFDDLQRIIRSGQRVSKCFMEILVYFFRQKPETKTDQQPHWLHFQTSISAARLLQAFWTRLWYDSSYVSRQLPKIGLAFSTILAENGYTSFNRLLESNPRQIEFHLKRKPPFGSMLIEEIKNLPRYQLALTRQSNCSLKFSPFLEDHIESRMQIEFKCLIQQQSLSSSNILKPDKHYFHLIIGCEECDQILAINRLNDRTLMQSTHKQSIILIKTKFDDENESTDQIENGNQKDPVKKNETKGKKKAGDKNKNNKDKESQQATDEKPKIWPEKFVKFIRQIEEECKNSIGNNIVHCSLRKTSSHTIIAHIISENFAGLDSETKSTIRYPFQQMDLLSTQEFDLLDSFDDDEYEEILAQHNIGKERKQDDSLSTLDSIDINDIQSTSLDGMTESSTSIITTTKKKMPIFNIKIDDVIHDQIEQNIIDENYDEDNDDDESLNYSIFTRFRNRNHSNTENELQKFVSSNLPETKTTTSINNNRKNQSIMNETKVAKIFPVKRKVCLQNPFDYNCKTSMAKLGRFNFNNDDKCEEKVLW
nr:probable ATP-dependent DNA helicase HFM1 isoform X2 [Dermatophagoides farinae]